MYIGIPAALNIFNHYIEPVEGLKYKYKYSTWLRIWSNSSQVEEKNGSLASLLNGTRPEIFCLSTFQTLICQFYRHLFVDELVLDSSWSCTC